MELKTLKDLYSLNTGHHNWAKNLKKEAIKEIKLIQSGELDNCFNIYHAPGMTLDVRKHNSLIQYIAWKFNITEEDLK